MPQMMWPANDKRWRDCTWREWLYMAAVWVTGFAGMALTLVMIDSFRIPHKIEESSSLPISGHRCSSGDGPGFGGGLPRGICLEPRRGTSSTPPPRGRAAIATATAAMQGPSAGQWAARASESCTGTSTR
jgi:hypothetical protein